MRDSAPSFQVGDVFHGFFKVLAFWNSYQQLCSVFRDTIVTMARTRNVSYGMVLGYCTYVGETRA